MMRLIMAIRLSKLPSLYYMYLIVMAWRCPNISFFVCGTMHLAYGKG